MSLPVLPTLIAAKIFAPTPRPDLLPRPRLTNRIGEGIAAGVKVVVMAAPPGFGKSTSSLEVAAAVRAGGGHVAWLALDAEDNDPTRWLVHLIGAVEQAIPGTGQAALAQLASLVAEGIPSPPPAPVLALLANALRQAVKQTLLIVLDDYHLIDQPGHHHALANWVDLLPPGVVLLLATRSEPPLPLARWRVRRQLLEVRATDLQFTAAETEAFFQGATQLAISSDIAALAAKRTEGWAAGLQLVALALDGNIEAGVDPFTWLAGLGGDDRYVADYLVEEVLARQPESIQQFLLQTALVERLCGPLCDALLALAPGTGQRLLEQVERANLFLIPLDQRRQWYRYHHLFRDLLRQQLRRNHPDLVVTLHERAAQWYVAQGLVDEAIEEALTGELWELAMELITMSFPTVLRQGRWTTMRRWLAALPSARLASSPQLCTWYAQMLIYTGEPGYALELLATAEEGWRSTGNEIGLAEALLVRANLARLRDDPEQVRSIAAEITTFSTPPGLTIEVMLACNLAIATQQAGEVHQAIEQLTTFLAATSFEEATILTLLARSHLGDAYVALGEVEMARAAYQMVIDLSQGRNLFPLLRAHMGLATLSANLGEWDSAAQHAQEAIRLAQGSERTLYTTPALLTLARVFMARGDGGAADRLAQQSLDLAHKLGNARQAAQAEAWIANKSTPSLRLAATADRGQVESLPEPLTVRESEVLKLVAVGASNQQIADELVISLNTVKKHVANLLSKLQAESRTHALARARDLGLI